MRRLVPFLVLALTLPVGAFAAKTVTPFDALKTDIQNVQAMLKQDAVSSERDQVFSTATNSSELLPNLPGSVIPLTKAQERLISRACMNEKTKTRCEVLKCRLMGECRGR